MVIQHIERVPLGYKYWTNIVSRHGWRQVGAEAFGVVDDYGNLVIVGECR